MERNTHTIDAAGKIPGRLASQIAILLRGKQRADFVPYKDMGDYVVVKNVEGLKFTGKKLVKKKYYRHSGYLGSLKEIPLKRFFKETPERFFKKVVFGMLPKNKLRDRQIKRLKFE